MSIPASCLAAARAAHAKFYPRGPFVSIQIAQGILESGNWEKPSGKNNFFGVKATQAQIEAKQATKVQTHETVNGVFEEEPQWFADYPSLEAGFIAHARLLTTPEYIDCQRALTPDEYADALEKDHYASGEPGVSYAQALKNLMKQDNLYALDLPMVSVPAPAPAASVSPIATPIQDASMFSFSALFSMLTNAPALVTEAVTLGEEVVTNIETIANGPTAKALEAFINANFSHVATPGSASVLEPKAPPAKA